MYYHRLEKIPLKSHTQFREPDRSLYKEEFVSSEGLSGIYSNLYYVNAPIRIKPVPKSIPYEPKIIHDYALNQTHLNTSTVETTREEYPGTRKVLRVNYDCSISSCSPKQRKMDYFYKNAEGDEVIFVHDGNGVLTPPLGKSEIKKGDYVVIPGTIIYKLEFDEDPLRLLITESASPIDTVKQYRNQISQLLEHSPYCEKDICPPGKLITDSKKGDHLIQIKKKSSLHQYIYNYSPLNLVGWDGFLWLYTFSINDFEPITGRIHQPPLIHQSFQVHNFVIYFFVPCLFDYHPQAIFALYNHGNNVEKSIGAMKTHELAEMIDMCTLLCFTEDSMGFLNKDYPMSRMDSATDPYNKIDTP